MSTDAVATEISTVEARPVERSETVAVGAADELTGPAVVGVEADGIRAQVEKLEADANALREAGELLRDAANELLEKFNVAK